MGIACPISPRLNPREIADYAALCEPRFCITDAPELVAGLDLAGCWHVADMPRDIAALPDQASLDPEADAEILGTSGTTGKIKGVVVSHPDLMSNVTGYNMDRSRSTLNALPLTGSGGNIGIVMLPARGGATAITQQKFDPKGFLELAKLKRPNLVYLVPSMLRLVLDHPEVGNYDMDGVKYLMTGTAPLPHDSVRRAAELWPHLRIRNSYGMSEGGVGLGTTSQEQVLKPGCVGKLPAHMQIRDGDGNVVTEPGVVGEIYGWQKHPRRYWNDPEATAISFKGGWTKTGDLGFVDEDGDLIMAKPVEGAHHPRRLQHHAARDRNGAASAPGGAAGRGRRGAARGAGRGYRGGGDAAPRLRRSDGGRHHRFLQGASGRQQGAADLGGDGPDAAQSEREDFEEGSGGAAGQGGGGAA